MPKLETTPAQVKLIALCVGVILTEYKLRKGLSEIGINAPAKES